MMLTNPLFGEKSGITVIGEDGEGQQEVLTIVCNDFWAITNDKHLNFVQHVRSLLRNDGRSAMVVVPDNVLLEGGGVSPPRSHMLHNCDAYNLLRLPTGTFYANGVKAIVLFFDRRISSEKPWTKKL